MSTESKRRRFQSGKLGPGTATPSRTGQRGIGPLQAADHCCQRGQAGPHSSHDRDPGSRPETGVHLGVHGVAWTDHLLSHQLLLMRPDRSAAAARKLPESRHAALLACCLTLTHAHSHTHSTLDHTSNFRPLSCLAWLLAPLFTSCPSSTPASPPSSPIHHSCFPSSSFAISSCTLRGRAAVVFPLRYPVDLHTYTYIHLSADLPACSLLPACAACLLLLLLLVDSTRSTPLRL